MLPAMRLTLFYSLSPIPLRTSHILFSPYNPKNKSLSLLSSYTSIFASSSMALKTVHVFDVPKLDNAASMLYSDRSEKGVAQSPAKTQKFLVVGHRGSGMNMQSKIKENTLLSFNNAGRYPVDYIEFDVQVTKDNHAIIFHDNFIVSEEDGNVIEKRVTDLSLEEFLCYGPQREPGNIGKTLLRKTEDGKALNWKVEEEDCFCTLQEAFEKVEGSLGFNIELKFDDYIVYEEEEIVHALQVILEVVYKYAKERPVMFSTFQPDAAGFIKRLQKSYPVFFLTDGGSELYPDVRRNSLEEAMRLCLKFGLEGIVSEVSAVFRNPREIQRIKESKFSLLTYGKLNNVAEAVYVQHLMDVDGVIVDLVPEISKAVSVFMETEKENKREGEGQFLVPRS